MERIDINAVFTGSDNDDEVFAKRYAAYFLAGDSCYFDVEDRKGYWITFYYALY